MTILHLGHQPADVIGINSARISTDAAGFDADLDVNTLAFDAEREAFPFGISFDAPTGDMWLQFRFVAPDSGDQNFGADTPFVSFFDTNNALVARLYGLSGDGSIEVQAHGDTQANGATSFVKASAVAYWMDIKVSVGADIVVAFYVDGALQGSATAANTGGKGKPTAIRFDNAEIHGYYYARTWYYAHITVLDGVSTIGRRFARQTANTVGAHDQWAGSLASLADGNIATRMTSDTAGQRQNATLAGPTGPAGAAIAGVHLKAVAQAGTSGPGSLAGSVRLGATDHDAPVVALSTERPEQAIFSWGQNPDTSAAWTDTDLPGELGLVSAP